MVYWTNFLFSSVPFRKKCPHGAMDLLGPDGIPNRSVSRINLAKKVLFVFFLLFSSFPFSSFSVNSVFSFVFLIFLFILWFCSL